MLDYEKQEAIDSSKCFICGMPLGLAGKFGRCHDCYKPMDIKGTEESIKKKLESDMIERCITKSLSHGRKEIK